MKQHIVRLGVLGCLVALTGCANIIKEIDRQTEGVTGADPLDTTKLTTDLNGTNPATKKSALLQLAAQSYQACDDYKRILLLGSRGSNFLFDVGATTFSTLGTVFTHVDVIHGFTAATAITTGTKTALDADIYQNATAPLMVAAINQTYGTHMAQFVASLEGSSPGAATQQSSDKATSTTDQKAASKDGAAANGASGGQSALANSSAPASSTQATASSSATASSAQATANSSAPGSSQQASASSSAPAGSQQASASSSPPAGSPQPKANAVTDIPSGTEYVDLVRIHTECSLTEAMAEIQTLQQNQSTPPATDPRVAFMADVAKLGAANLSPTQITALQQTMTTAGIPTDPKSVLANDRVNLMAWGAATTTTGSQVQLMDTAIKTYLPAGN